MKHGPSKHYLGKWQQRAKNHRVRHEIHKREKARRKQGRGDRAK